LYYPGLVRALWFCLAGACSFTHGAANNGGSGDAATRDGPPDTAIDSKMIDTLPGMYCVGTGLNICLPAPPTGDITLPMANPLVTDTDSN